MNRIYNKDKRLESHRWFPAVAWIVVIGFAVFVYQLSSDVSEKTKRIGASNIDEEAYLIPIDELRRRNSSGQ